MMKENDCILCFGDSLTAGTSPPLLNNAPYSPHLEKSLQSIGTEHKNKNVESISVKWLGLPGWTADALLEQKTLESILQQLSSQKSASSTTKSSNQDDDKQTGHETDQKSSKSDSSKPYPSLIIILAGTNDLGYQVEVDPILNPLINLHKIAHDQGIPTVALSIPPSAWQSQSKDARDLAASVNAKIELWATSTDVGGDTEGKKMVKYVPFPIETFEKDSEYWSFDGLHFSPEGYKYIGESLAPTIYDILQELDAWGTSIPNQSQF